MKRADFLKLAASIILCQAAGFLGSLFTIPAISTWYATLTKPPFTPPNWIFSPVWISLFILMGVSFFLVWQRQGHPHFNKAVLSFSAQLILNVLWSLAFFGLRWPLLGLIDIILLWLAILFTIRHFSRVSKLAAALLLPYLFWVSFAALLNFSLWVQNR